MGTLIPMPRPLPDATGSRHVAGRLATGAEIVFFTGVRYERHDDASSVCKTGLSKKAETSGNSRPRRRRA